MTGKSSAGKTPASSGMRFLVRFDDKTERQLTSEEIAALRNARRYVVYGRDGKVIFAKTHKGK